MGKPKIYLDTSVISHLQHEDTPDKMNETLMLWDSIKAGQYAVYASTTTLDEIEACPEQKRKILFDYLNQIEYTIIEPNNEIAEFAQKLIDEGILKKKSLDDCIHIASAVIGGCDIIVSWNFKHLVRFETISGVREICFKNRYKIIDIYPPTLLINKGDE